MTAGIIAAGLAAMLVAGLLREAPPSPWAARRRRREAAELAAWAAYRAAFYAASPTPAPIPAPRRPARVRSARRGPRYYLVRDPVD